MLHVFQTNPYSNPLNVQWEERKSSTVRFIKEWNDFKSSVWLANNTGSSSISNTNSYTISKTVVLSFFKFFI